MGCHHPAKRLPLSVAKLAWGNSMIRLRPSIGWRMGLPQVFKLFYVQTATNGGSIVNGRTIDQSADCWNPARTQAKVRLRSAP